MESLQVAPQSRRRFRPFDWPILVQASLGMVAMVILASSVITYANIQVLRAELRQEIGARFAIVAESQMALLVDVLSEQISVLRGITMIENVAIGTVTANARYGDDLATTKAQLLAVDAQWRGEGDDSQLVKSIISPQHNPLAAQLLNYKSAFSDHVEILLTDRYGGLLAATDRTSGYHQGDEHWWQAAYNRGQGAIYVSQPHYDESAGHTVLTLAVPIVSDNSEVVGIAGSILDMTAIYRVIGEMQFGETGHVTLVDSTGRIIADSRQEQVGEQAPPSWIVPEHLLATDQWHEGVNAEDIPCIIGHTTIAGVRTKRQDEARAINALAWMLFVHQTQEEVDRPMAGAIWTGLLITGALALGTILLAVLVARGILIPITSLVQVARQMAEGDLGARARVRRRDEIGELAGAFNSMANEIVGTVGTLEQSIAERTRGLQATIEVSRAITSMLDPDELLQRVVDLARDRLELYYVGLFLADEERRFAVLQAGTGDAGRQMMERGHKLEIGGRSMIGQCVYRDEARIALDVGEEAVRFDNPFLPETRSEMALPLRSRGVVMGALTVQSTEEAAFDETDIAVLQAMADQVAVALDNARLFANAQEAMADMEATHQRYLGRAWSDYLKTTRTTNYEAVRSDAGPIGDDVLLEIQKAVRQLSATAANGDGAERRRDHSALVMPITLRGTLIGALGLHDADVTRQWSEDEIALVEAIAERMGLAAENLRLIEETERRAAFDRLISDVTARVRETLDIDTMLKTAAVEVRQAMNLPEVVIRLAPGAISGAGNGAERRNDSIPYRGQSSGEWPSDGGNDG